MLLPSDRYRFSSRERRRGPRIAFIVGIVVVVLLAGAGVLLLERGKLPALFGKGATTRTLTDLWSGRQYAAINARAEAILKGHPLDATALVYDGFAYFYEALGEQSLEAQLPLLDKSIASLRKALLVRDGALTPTVNYVLGKAYYQKGKFYLDLAIKYLNRSIEGGYVANDTYEYLGLAYSDLGEYDKAAGYFEKAISQNPNALLYYILAQTYYKSGDGTKSEEYLQRAVNKSLDTKDTAVEEKALFLLGRIYTDRKDYFKAEEQYQQIVEIDANSADAHYFLGDLYDQQGDKIKARAEWRAALRIDPSHAGARLKLYH